MCIHVYGEVLQTTYSTYTKVYVYEYPLNTYITKLLQKSVQIRAAFRNFFKGVGARLRFQEILGVGGEGQAWVQNLLSDVGWPFQGVPSL